MRQHKYRLHKASGQALVEINGKRFYLGKHGTAQSRELYHRLLAEHEASRAVVQADPNSISVGQLLLGYWDYVKARYRKNGKPTTEVNNYKLALRVVRESYASLPANDFTPLCLIACRKKLVDKGYCRRQINARVSRMRRAFQWGVTRQLVKAETWQALRAVEALREGEDGVRDNPRVMPIDRVLLDAVQPFVSAQVWALLAFQWWTGCRPGEACVLRRCDIDMSGPVWEYRPHVHKLQHRKIARVVYIGPQAQEILRPWLRAELDAYLFQPREAWEAWLASVRKRPAKRKMVKQFAPCYTPAVYCAAVKRACEAAKIVAWSPNQLRHAAATRIRKEFGLEMARVVLGHTSATTTEGYAEPDLEKSREIMRRIG